MRPPGRLVRSYRESGVIRIFAIAIVAAALLPAQAEAAKLRFGKRSPHVGAEPARGRAGVIVVRGAAGTFRTQPAAAGGDNDRVPFPPSATAQPTLLRLTSAEPGRNWCRSEIVVGGFCILN